MEDNIKVDIFKVGCVDENRIKLAPDKPHSSIEPSCSVFY